MPLLKNNQTQVVVPPIPVFKLASYLGEWYEIARMDNKHEKGLDLVRANYELNSDGKIIITGRGYSLFDRKWKELKATAIQTNIKNHLKVYYSFFPEKYNIAYIDDNYKHAVITGGSLKNLWFMAREPHISTKNYNQMISIAKSLGYDVSKLHQTIQE